jgi:hypothetical protein
MEADKRKSQNLADNSRDQQEEMETVVEQQEESRRALAENTDQMMRVIDGEPIQVAS